MYLQGVRPGDIMQIPATCSLANLGWAIYKGCHDYLGVLPVTTGSGAIITYDHLVVCPGIQLDWGKIPGMADAIATPHASSNYTYDLAPKTWELIRGMRSGTAIFTMPPGPISRCRLVANSTKISVSIMSTSA